MAIQDKMYEQIALEIDNTVKVGKEKVIVDYKKAKDVAKVLAELSTNTADADSLTNQYIANIKNICND